MDNSDLRKEIFKFDRGTFFTFSDYNGFDNQAVQDALRSERNFPSLTTVYIDHFTNINNSRPLAEFLIKLVRLKKIKVTSGSLRSVSTISYNALWSALWLVLEDANDRPSLSLSLGNGDCFRDCTAQQVDVLMHTLERCMTNNHSMPTERRVRSLSFDLCVSPDQTVLSSSQRLLRTITHNLSSPLDCISLRFDEEPPKTLSALHRRRRRWELCSTTNSIPLSTGIGSTNQQRRNILNVCR